MRSELGQRFKTDIFISIVAYALLMMLSTAPCIFTSWPECNLAATRARANAEA
jgi:hypothetical protein